MAHDAPASSKGLSFKRALWDADDLTRRLSHALRTAETALERLAPNGYTDAEEALLEIKPEKVISETALLLLAASSAAHIPQIQQGIERTARTLLPYARSERMLLGICLEPALALDYAQAHACLCRLGYPDARFDKLLRASLESQTARGRERPPHRMLEQQWVLGLWGQPEQRDKWASHSAMGTPMDLLHGTRDDGYAFTHALMYLTYGRDSAPRLPRTQTDILAEAEALLAWCLDAEDYDLAGEVLLAWPLLGRTWSPAAVFGLQVLTAVEDKAGFLPSPATRLERLSRLQGDARTDYLLASAYHTMYVMGLVCAAALQPGRLPAGTVAESETPTDAAGPILELLDHGSRDKTPHWRDAFARLSTAQQGELSSLLLAMALRRTTRKHNFDGVLALLKHASRFELDNTPIASQAAELLERLALYNDA